jgi:hypothetical protein
VFLKAGSQPSAPDFVLSDYFAGSLVSSIQESKDFILGNIFVERLQRVTIHMRRRGVRGIRVGRG